MWRVSATGGLTSPSRKGAVACARARRSQRTFRAGTRPPRRGPSVQPAGTRIEVLEPAGQPSGGSHTASASGSSSRPPECAAATTRCLDGTARRLALRRSVVVHPSRRVDLVADGAWESIVEHTGDGRGPPFAPIRARAGQCATQPAEPARPTVVLVTLAAVSDHDRDGVAGLSRLAAAAPSSAHRIVVLCLTCA